MRSKLSLLIAIACFAGVVFMGSSFAGAQVAGVNVPEALNCAVGLDDDGDGTLNQLDPDCGFIPAAPEVPDPVPVPEPPSTPVPTPTPDTGGRDDGSDGGSNSPSGGTNNGSTGGNTGIGEQGPGGVSGNSGIDGATGRNDGIDRDGADDGNGGIGGNEQIEPPPAYTPDGAPTVTNPTTTIAPFGPAPVGVPNFVIDSFEIPPFLLPIYQACGTEYGIAWQVLASINKIETAFGTNLNVSYAGAIGWMQFMPSTWAAYGVDANGDGRKDPYNPVDGICAAARYLKAAGGMGDLYNAIYAYNHADWYVDEVLLYARSYGRLPDDLVASLTGLTEGAHFPVAADARYADDIEAREALRRSTPARGTPTGNAADVIEGSPTRRGINIFSREGAPIVAVNDGVIKAIGKSPELGRYIVLQDAYGNRFTYADLGSVLKVHPVPKREALNAEDFEIVSPPNDAAPDQPATDSQSAAAGDTARNDAVTDDGNADDQSDDEASDDDVSAAPVNGENEGPHVNGGAQDVADHADGRSDAPSTGSANGGGADDGPVNTEDMRPRLYANPDRPSNVDRASLSGQLDDLAGKRVPGYETFKNYFNDVFAFNAKTTELRPLREGSKVIAGTVLGRMGGEEDGIAPHINFAIRPAGRGAPSIDPKPILDGWKLLEATAIYRASDENPFFDDLGIGQILLLNKTALMRRVLSDPRLEIYSCGRTDIQNGIIGRRVLAVLEYLAEKGFNLTITSLQCGHSFLTASGNPSNHSFGNAVDIAAVNGIPILGNQGPGTITEAVLKTVLQLQGTMRPEELISLMDLGGPSFPLPDHDDHIHIGYDSSYSGGSASEQFVQLLKPDQWERLIDRLGEIDNPEVPVGASDFSLPADSEQAGDNEGNGSGDGQGGGENRQDGNGQGDGNNGGGNDGKPNRPHRASKAHHGE